MRNVSLKYLLFFLLAAFALGGCGIFESEPVKEELEEEIERTYNKTIEREYSNEFERELIDSAEAAYPPRDSVVALFPPELQNNVPEIGYWHYRRIDGVLIPYAITFDAVKYYSTLIDSMKAGATHQLITKADFKYTTSISFEEEYSFEWPGEWPEVIRIMYMEIAGKQPPEEFFEEVYVVKKFLNWSHYCGKVCALSVSHVHVVVFDKAGNLKQIFFDGAWFVPSAS